MYKKLLFFLFAYLCFSHAVRSQTVKIEYPEYTSLVVIEGNFLWQATSGSLYQRDLSSGQIIRELNYPVGYHKPWDMVTDQEGNLWLMSPYYGVARYNQQGNWQVWDTLNTPVFKGFFLNNIAFDNTSKQIFLFAPGNFNTPDKGFVFDGNNWLVDPYTNGMTGGYGTSWLYQEGAQGRLVYVMSDSLMYRDQGKWVGMKKIGKSVYPKTMAFDTTGALWVMTYGDYYRLFRYDQVNGKAVYLEKTKLEINHMLFDQNNNHWLATEKNGLLLRRPDKTYITYPNTFPGYDKTVPIKEIYADSLDQLWLQQNLDYLPITTRWQNGLPRQNLINKSPQFGITGIDRNGCLWTGGSSRLFTRKKRNAAIYEFFPLYSLLDPTPFHSSSKLKHGKGEEMWLLDSQNDLFLHFNGSNWENHTSSAIMGAYNLMNDTDGNIYIHNSSNIYQYDPLAKTWNKVNIKLFGQDIFVNGEYAFDAQNQLWFVGEEGLGVRKINGKVDIFILPFQIKSYPEVELRVSPSGNIYLTLVNQSDNRGYLYEFDPVALSWTNIALPEIWASFAIRKSSYDYEWHIDKKGRIWLNYEDDETQKVWYYEAGNWKQINGLPDASAYHIESDFDDHVFIDYWYAFATISFGATDASERRASVIPLHTYPNPAQGSFFVQIPENINGRLCLRDAQGRVVREIKTKTAQNGFFVARNGLSAGLYYLLFEQEDGQIATGKVILD